MVVVATYWLSYEYVSNARQFNDPVFQSRAMARGAYQVLVLVAPYLSDEGRTLFTRLASEYLKD